MRGLLLRLIELDPEAGASLRLIEYFDELLGNRASIDAIMRATAMVAECTVGFRDHQAGHVIRIDLHGTKARKAKGPVMAERQVMVQGAAVGNVWLERDVAHPYDEMVVERMALTMAARWAARPLPLKPSDPTLVESAIAESSSEEDRYHALRLLGLQPDRPVRAIAARVIPGHSLPDGAQRLSARLSQDGVSASQALVIAEKAAILCQSSLTLAELLESTDKACESRLQVGIGAPATAMSVRSSWVSAGISLRFVGIWPRAHGPVAYEELGSVAMLAAVDEETVRDCLDVKALDGLAASPSGRTDVEALLGVIRAGSLRASAAERHMHHSSVANRLRHVEDVLGVELDDPAGRLRAHTAAILWALNLMEGPASWT